MEFRKLGLGDAAAGLCFINSLVAEGADIGVRSKLTIAQERRWLKDLLSDKARIYIGAFEGGRLVGAVEVRRNREQVSRHVGGFAISVVKDCRGAGLAYLLAERIFLIAKSRGISILELRVFSTNRRAMRFYRRLGFRKIAVLEKELKLGGKYVDAFLMRMEL